MTQYDSAATPDAKHYALFGLTLRSTIPLPELDETPPVERPAVTIDRGEIPPALDDDGALPSLVPTGRGAQLQIAEVARFLVRDGSAILVDPDPAASARNVRLYLLGSVMGVLLHQRGILPLHANAIDIDGGAVAFLGASGAGKSTLAAAFHDAGRRILSDDVCAVVPTGFGFLAQPGIPRLRLWRDAVERSGREAQAYERAFDALDKYTVRTDRSARSEALPLKALYLLVRQDTDADFAIRRLAGVDAVRALVRNTYRGGCVPVVGNARAHFETCTHLSRQVPVFELRRPWDPARIVETPARIEAHLRA